ncbi:MAG: hypothetical protein ACT6FE_00845 [Methanosarcinaceae archaeon]
MDGMRVLASFNQKKCLFSLEALEGENKDRVIAHVEEVILRQCKFSKNKDKTAGVIGIWEGEREGISAAVREYFGDDEDENGYSPTYFGELIKYDTDWGEYIVNSYADLIQYSVSHDTIQEIENDNELKQLAIDNAAMIYLEVPEEDCEDANDITGIAYYWRGKKGITSNSPKTQITD